MNNILHSRYIFVIIFLIIIYLAFTLIKPFISVILTSMLLVYIFYPVYKYIYKKTKKENFSALAVSILVVLIISLPFLYMISGVAKEANYLLKISKDKITYANIFSDSCSQSNIICSLSYKIKEFISNPKVMSFLEDLIKQVTTFIIKKTSDFLISLPKFLLDIFLIIFIMFYLFKEGDYIVSRVEKILPLKAQDRKNVVKKINDSIYAILFGSIIVALIQGVLGTIGYYVVGMKSVILWGIITILFAFVPFLGTAIVWVPASLYFIISGLVSSNPLMIGKGVGLFLYGLILVSSIDNIIRPKLIGSRAGIHPILILLGVLGGVALFGVIGMIVGPLIFALFIVFLDIYERDKDEV